MKLRIGRAYGYVWWTTNGAGMLGSLKNALKSILPPSTTMVDRRVDAICNENVRLREQVSRLADRLESVCEESRRAREGLAALRADGLLEEMTAGSLAALEGSPEVVVSVASYGKRIASIAPMIDSLRRQTVHPNRAFLWLPRRDFPRGLRDAPAEVICALHDADVEPRFVENDLGPHNKYFWAMRAYPDSTVITLDDDINYPCDLLEKLLSAHKAWPREVIGMRTHLITFHEGGLDPYERWEREQTKILDTPTQRIISTGVGGVLYPAHCLDSHAFDEDAIARTCLYADDLWLKVMEVLKGTSTICPSDGFTLDYVEGTQDVALYTTNLNQGGNDAQINEIMKYVSSFHPVEDILLKMAGGPQHEDPAAETPYTAHSNQRSGR